jgi:hypothetical protein
VTPERLPAVGRAGVWTWKDMPLTGPAGSSDEPAEQPAKVQAQVQVSLCRPVNAGQSVPAHLVGPVGRHFTQHERSPIVLSVHMCSMVRWVESS